MSMVLEKVDLPSMRQITHELIERLSRCGNGEGMICSNLDESIDCYNQVCADLLNCVNFWAQDVFKGQLPFNVEIEDVLKNAIRELLIQAKKIANRGIDMNGVCYELKGLGLLCMYVVLFESRLEEWASPQLAVSPAPRMKIPEASECEIIKSIEQLSNRLKDEP